MTLSVVIIAKNEADMIADAIESVLWTDEVILVDTGSKDDTKNIAKAKGVKVTNYRGRDSYSDWRNTGLREAKGDWILYLDSDERITPLLKAEITGVMQANLANVAVYAIPRRNFIFGKEFKHVGQWPDYQKRLFRKDLLKKWIGDLHEEPVYGGELRHLRNPMVHLKNMTLTEMMDKTNWWSDFEARKMYEADHPPMNIPRFLSAMAREFWLRMVRQTAFLDGPKGIIYALYQVYSRFVSYAKLWEMQVER